MPAGPGQQQGLAEAVRPETLVDGMCPQPVLQPEPLQLADRARGEAVAAGLVTREDRRVGQHHFGPAAGRPRGRRRPRGAGADDENVGVRGGLVTHDCLRAPVCAANPLRRPGSPSAGNLASASSYPSESLNIPFSTSKSRSVLSTSTSSGRFSGSRRRSRSSSISSLSSGRPPAGGCAFLCSSSLSSAGPSAAWSPPSPAAGCRLAVRDRRRALRACLGVSALRLTLGSACARRAGSVTATDG